MTQPTDTAQSAAPFKGPFRVILGDDAVRDVNDRRVALCDSFEKAQWLCNRLKQPAAPEQEREDEWGALIEIGAKALYDETPLEEGGEAIDGFQVSPNTTVTWAQIVEHDGYAEIASDFRRMARAVLTAAWQAARAAAPASPLTEEERADLRLAIKTLSDSGERGLAAKLVGIRDRLTGKE